MYLLLKFRFSYANQIDYKVKLSLFDISHDKLDFLRKQINYISI